MNQRVWTSSGAGASRANVGAGSPNPPLEAHKDLEAGSSDSDQRRYGCQTFDCLVQSNKSEGYQDLIKSLVYGVGGAGKTALLREYELFKD